MTELQNDRMTDRTKTICPPIFDLGGIKIDERLSLCLFSFHSDTFQKVQDNSEKVWRFHRFSLVYEYYERPALFPPLILLNHIYRAVRWLVVRCSKCCNKGIHTRNSFSKSPSYSFRFEIG